MKKKFLACTCLFLAVLAVLSSCVLNDRRENSSDTDNGLNEDTLKIIENGKSSYTIFYSYDVSETVFLKIKDTVATIKSKTNVELPMKMLERGTTLSETEYAILIGSAADTSLDRKLRSNDYIVCVSGDNIIITAPNDDALIKALTYFSREIFLKEYSDGVFALPSDYKYLKEAKYVYENVMLLGVDISEYTVVVPQNATSFELYAAKTIWNHISQYAGYEIDFVTDSEPQRDREIVIGKTNRRTAELSKNEYLICAEQGRLFMVADGMYSYGAMADYVTNTMLYSEGNTINVDAVTEIRNNVSEDFSALQKQKYGEYRVLFNNILGNCDQELYPVAKRNEMLAEIYKTYDADVIGLQECSANSRSGGNRSIIKLLQAQGYTEVPVTGCATNLFTPILYKTSRLELVESGYLLYSLNAKKDNSKSLVWAVFKDIQTKEMFAVISTHFTVYGDDDRPVEQARVGNATELIDTVKSIYSKYGCPTVIGGDLNCNISSEAMKLIMKESVYAQSEAAITNNSKTSHGYPTYSQELGIYTDYSAPKVNGSAESIDHICIFNADNVSVEAFDICTDKYSCLSTDHCPIAVDFSIEKN